MDGTVSEISMILMAFALGVRHGFDLDHLATIDAITRTIRHQRNVANMVGILFSLGHGLVVTIVSVIIGSGLIRAHVPEWLDGVGNWISIFFLIFFGLLNFWNLFHNPSQPTLPVGIRSLLAKKIVRVQHGPLMIAAIGALFALSFDTISQIALFSIAAAMVSGWLFAGILGLFFMVGMMVSDGLNGFLVSVLIQRTDTVSFCVSRCLGWTISLFSFGIGCVGLWKIFQ
jgi:high-affinity nickel-transport protein